MVYNIGMRILKQLFFGIILLVLIGGIGWGVYAAFIKPDATCTDGKQNGNETGVDCGGACGNQCIPVDIKPISKRGNIQILPIGSSTRATVLVQIQNLNSDYGAKFDYTLSLKEKTGREVAVSLGKNIIYPAEIKYLAFPNMEVSLAPSELVADFRIEKTEWVKEEDMKKPSVFIQNEATVIHPDRIEVSGKFTNADAGKLEGATVVAILFDNRGSMIGASETRVENVESGEARSFIVIHPFVSSVNISRTQVFVYPYR